MIVKLLTEHHLEFLSLKEAAEARQSLHMSKYHIVGNHMHWHIKFLFLHNWPYIHVYYFQVFCIH